MVHRFAFAELPKENGGLYKLLTIPRYLLGSCMTIAIFSIQLRYLPENKHY